MKRAWLLRALFGTVALLVSVEVQACIDASRRQAYFTYQRPTRGEDMVALRVELVPEDIREVGAIRARLLGGPLHLSRDGFVTIELPEPAVGTNCVELGPTDAPVFVVGRLRRSSSGLILVASPMQVPPRQAWPVLHHSRAELDQYIVDPAYLTPEERRRRENRPND